MIVRGETRRDHAAIRAINMLAFGGEYEAVLIDKLRAEQLATVSLVAIDDDAVMFARGRCRFPLLPIERIWTLDFSL